MISPNATRVVALVEYMQSIRDRPVLNFIAVSVGKNGAPRPSIPKNPMPGWILEFLPLPTSILARDFFDIQPKTLLC